MSEQDGTLFSPRCLAMLPEMTQTLAVQSWCFRDFKPLPDFFAKLKACGVSATEVCGVHANFTDSSTWKSTFDQFNTAGVKIVCIGVETMTGDVARDKPRFEFCKAGGIKNMSISFAPELMDNAFAGLKNVDALAADYGVKVGIHNHGGYDWLGNDRILKYIFDRTQHVGLHMDTAWAIDAKQDPCKWVEQFARRLYGVHVKDFLYNEKRQPRDVVIGTGNLDLPKLVAALKAISFAGPIVIEYEGDFANPVPTLAECVNRITPLLT
jgi:inosose dehydratase